MELEKLLFDLMEVIKMHQNKPGPSNSSTQEKAKNKMAGSDVETDGNFKMGDDQHLCLIIIGTINFGVKSIS